MNNHMSSGTNHNHRGGKITEARNGVMRLEEQQEEYSSRTTMASNFFRGRQFLYIIIGLLALLSIGLLIGVIVASNQTNGSSSSTVETKLCDTAGCITNACDVLRGMNLQEDPCKDIYAYSCGHWNDIPDDKSVYGIADKAEDDILTSLERYLPEYDSADTNAMIQTRTFYLNCTSSEHSDSTSDLISMLETFGGWPVSDIHVDQLVDYLSKLVSFKATDLASTVFHNGLFSIFVRKNELGKNAIYLDEPELGLDPRYLLGTDEISKTKVAIYHTFIVSSLKAINSTLTQADLDKVAGDIIAFEKSLAKDLIPVVERRDKSWDERSRSIAEVQGYFLTPNVKLIDIIRDLFADESFTISEPVSVMLSSNYMNTTVKRVLSATDLKGLADYILWRYVQFQSWFVGGPLRDAYNQYQQDDTQIMHPPRIEDSCAKLTNSLLSFATARIYINENPQKNKTQEGAIAEEMRQQFQVRLQDLKDTGKLNETTVAMATEKVKNMQFLLGFPNWIMNNWTLDQYYNFGTDKLDNGIYHNMQTLFKLLVQTEKNILRSPIDKSRWIIPPLSVKAHYDPLLNNLALPMGVLMSPYFLPDQLQLSNFARLGIIVAREMLHGFNIFGRQLNADGVLDDWWQFKDLIYFNDGADCFVGQYNDYCPQSGFCINGNQTLDENIADNGAVQLAYKAAMATSTKQILPGFPDMTDPQLFFVQYATIHCTSYRPNAIGDQIVTGIAALEEYRLKGTWANSGLFTDAFKCQRNRTDVCVIW